MTQTTEMQVTESQKVSTQQASKPQISEGTVKAFINGHIEKPVNSTLSIKTVVPCRFYRLNFYRVTTELIPDNKILDSRFIEIVHTQKGLELKEWPDLKS